MRSSACKDKWCINTSSLRKIEIHRRTGIQQNYDPSTGPTSPPRALGLAKSERAESPKMCMESDASRSRQRGIVGESERPLWAHASQYDTRLRFAAPEGLRARARMRDYTRNVCGFRIEGAFNCTAPRAFDEFERTNAVAVMGSCFTGDAAIRVLRTLPRASVWARALVFS